MELINSIDALGNLELHDSVLGSVDISVSTRTCKVKLLIYETPDSRDRVSATLIMEGVTSCVTSLDFPSLAANAKPGNVQNCRVDVDRKIVRLYLADGLLEITGGSVSLIRD